MIATTVSHPQPIVSRWTYERQIVTEIGDESVLDKSGITLLVSTLIVFQDIINPTSTL